MKILQHKSTLLLQFQETSESLPLTLPRGTCGVKKYIMYERYISFLT